MNKIYSLFALLAALSFPFNAPAQESGFYAGGSAGWSMIDDDFINDQKKTGTAWMTAAWAGNSSPAIT